MAEWDVIIVGAGPSGSSAAYELATAGKRILLVDKQAFPRDKPCGGGLTPKTLKRLRFDISPVIERTCHTLEITNNGHSAHLLPSTGLLCAMTQRPQFDAFLLQQALQAGAKFEVVSEIAGVVNNRHGVKLAPLNGQTLTAKWLIAADGAKSTIRRLIHRKPTVKQAFALEGKAPLLPGQSRISFDFFAVPWGYGWVFPKGDHLNVGIATFNRKIKISKKELNAYAQSKIGHSQLEDVVGYPLGIGIGNGARTYGRVLFVGDAAGSVEPLMGEGLHNAINSGQKAAAAIIASRTAWRAGWHYWFAMLPQQIDLLSAYNLHSLFYRFNRLGYWWLTRPSLLNSLALGFSSGRTTDSIIRRWATGRRQQITA